MRSSGWYLRGGAALAVLALGAAACGHSATNTGTGAQSGLIGGIEGTQDGFGGGKVPLNPGTATGGTLNIGVTSDVDYLDPARTYYAFSWDLHQLTSRTLLTYPDAANPQQGLSLVGDIATAPATGQSNNTVWTYHLKSGIKFQDGTAVTSQDVKYAIERTFATSVINGGPTYFQTFLDNPANPYKGPYVDKDPNHLGLASIQTPDASTITFHLNKPFAEWNFVMTLFGTSPVEPSFDLNPATGGANYNTHVQSTGPYEIASYVANKHIDLVRNPNYSAATDGTRPALPDKIDFTTNLDPATLDNDIIAGTYDLDMGGTGVQTATQARILADPTLKARALNPVTGFTRYLAIFTKVAPFTNVHCRRAVEYAVNKQEQVRARGGSISGGAPASTMDPPSLLGYQAYDLYASPNSAGDVAKAKAELVKCGKPNGFNTIIVTTNKGKALPQAAFLQQDLKAVGINAQVKTFDASTYYSSIVGVPANIHKAGYGIGFAGWGPDWPAPYGFYENIVDPRAILQQGNSNYAECDDPQLVVLIKKALAEPTTQAALGDWNQVDRLVLSDACDVPLTYDKALDLFSSRLKNVYIEPAFGIVDIRTLGVA